MKERQAAVNTRKRDDSPGWDKSWAETTGGRKMKFINLIYVSYSF